MEVDIPTTFDELIAPFDSYESQRRVLDADMLDALGRLDSEWPDDPSVPDLACELAVRHGISSHTAGERVRMARASRQLPAIARAHREGRLSWDQLRWLTRFATPETDQDWSVRACSMRPDELRIESHRQRRLTKEQAERDQAARSLNMWWDDDHQNLSFYGTLPAEPGSAFEGAVHQAAQKISVEDEVLDRKGAQQADALVGLVTSSGGRPQAPTLVIHADAEVLAGGKDGHRRVAETSKGVQFSHDAILRIACDARCLWLLSMTASLWGA